MTLNYSWKIANIELHTVSDDIFDLDVDAIVNSEQTDFILAGNQSSISGQVLSHFGYGIQSEIVSKTNGRKQELGTIITTGGAGRIKRIYHAGIHDPMIFLDSDKDSNQTEHIVIVRKCYRDILDNFFSSSLTSIAFPLLGTGLFNLDKRLVANEFYDQLLSISSKYSDVTGKQIWLVDKNHQGAQLMVQTIVQRFIDMAILALPARNIHFGLDLSLLDLFETKLNAATDPNWASWLLVRYYELIVDYLFIVLASAKQPNLFPKDVFKPGNPISFGAYRKALNQIATNHQYAAASNSWAMYLSNKFREHPDTCTIMERINHDRNNIAHGRKCRELNEIYEDILLFLTLIDWKNSLLKYTYPSLTTLKPWINVDKQTRNGDNEANKEFGILDRWKEGQYQYYFPYSGLVVLILE